VLLASFSAVDPELPECFLAIYSLAMFSLSQAAGNLLFYFFTGVVLTKVPRDEVVIDGLVKEFVEVRRATGLYLLPTGIASPKFIDPPPSLT
jgi:hypothetical protein